MIRTTKKPEVGKRAAIIFISFLVTGLILLGYFLQAGRKHLITDPYTAIPMGAGFVIETPDIQSFVNSMTTEKGIFGELGKVTELEAFNLSLKYLSVQLNNDVLKDIVNGNNAIISFYPHETGKLRSLMVMPVPQGTKLRHIKEIMQKSGVAEINQKKINRKTVLELPFNVGDRKDTAFLTVASGLLTCSTSENLLLRSSLLTGDEKDIRSEQGFLRILLASGKNEHKIFIVFNNLQKLIQPIFGKNYQDIAAKISRLAVSGGGDIYFNDNGLVLSGYSESAGTNEFLYKYKSVEPASFNTFRVLPSSTVLFETLILQALTPKRDTDTSFSEAYSLAMALKDYIGDEITSAIIDIKNNPVADNKILIYELRNRIQAEKIFLQQMGTEENENKALLFQPDDQIAIPVYKTQFKGLISVLVPEFAGDTDDSYFSFYDSYMITGSSYATISSFLYDNMLNKTLENDVVYRDFESTLPSRAVYYFYCVPGKITEYWSGFFSDDINKALISNKGSLNKIQSAGLLFAPSNGMIYNSISIMFKEEARQESMTEWETLLDTTASIKPFFFKNHINGSREIFIQDMKNNIYLINSTGRVLWKVPLNESINGSVYMIDFYRNGKYQLLFAGKNNLHLIDRNGNYVERYPVRLRSPATNSLALFDYDNNSDYRLLIAGEDKLIYAYDRYGSVVKGWKPFKTAGIVRSQLNYFRISGKDYLVASDELSIYFLDRRGNIRLNLKEPVIRASGSSLRLVAGSEPSVVCTSPDGTVQHIYFNGNVKKINVKNFSRDHSFDILDVDGDGSDEFIFVDKGVLYLYNQNEKEIIERDFGTEEIGGPLNFIFSPNENKIGIIDNENNLIYLINKNGDIMNGFPLRGASMFSIGKLSDNSGWSLIVGGTDRFLYNYKINTGFN